MGRTETDAPAQFSERAGHPAAPLQRRVGGFSAVSQAQDCHDFVSLLSSVRSPVQENRMATIPSTANVGPFHVSA